jgi:hypothetical protein
MPLAQLNLARARYPLSSAEMADFVGLIAEVNAGAEAADGFIWRLQDDGDGALSVRLAAAGLDGDDMLVNMSVWRDLAALRSFVIDDSGHRGAMKRRAEWFHRAIEPMTVCWFVNEGEFPTVADAQEKLLELRQSGPSEQLFEYSHRDSR